MTTTTSNRAASAAGHASPPPATAPASRDSVELPQEKLAAKLCDAVGAYLDDAQVKEVYRSYQLANKAHEGQFRLTGEPYVCHPLSVALILAEMHMDAKGVMAAVMHDVIEDTTVTKEQLQDQFGDEVANLVDGVSKLTQLDCKSQAEAQAQNVRKMVLAMVRDLRVIMVKLADRLHNMRTLDIMAPNRRRRIARETLDIYSPIAHRLGMNEIRQELEDLGFAAMYPMRARVLGLALKKARGSRRELVDIVGTALRARIAEAGFANAEVIGREKHLYSLYQKMRLKHLSFAQVFDVYAFRIIVDSIDECYRVLGIVHNLFKPVPGRFKDYIAVPKGNGYQSLHTVLAGPHGQPVEIQIRTRAMHHLAESGIASHWLYKSDQDAPNGSQARAHEWLRDLLEIQKSAGDSMEFLDNLKVDLFQQEVYVFTPKGRVVKLPRNASVVDFAYAVHTDVGNTCVSARIDRVLSPLQTTLENGQTVEIVTAPWARPNPLWLGYVVTAKARAAIRSYLRNFKKQEAVALGRRLLDKELETQGFRYDSIPDSKMDMLLQSLNIASRDALLENIGLGNRLPFLVVRQLLATGHSEDPRLHGGSEHKTLAPLIIKGTEGMVVNLAKCCRPIPGDPIIGFFNPGKGIVVHLHECKNVDEIRKKHMNWLDVVWDKQAQGEFPVVIRLELLNQVGTLAKVAATISSLKANIENVQIINQDSQMSIDIITLMVRDRVHLASVMRELKRLAVVVKISRVKSELRKKSVHGKTNYSD